METTNPASHKVAAAWKKAVRRFRAEYPEAANLDALRVAEESFYRQANPIWAGLDFDNPDDREAWDCQAPDFARLVIAETMLDAHGARFEA